MLTIYARHHLRLLPSTSLIRTEGANLQTVTNANGTAIVYKKCAPVSNCGSKLGKANVSNSSRISNIVLTITVFN